MQSASTLQRPNQRRSPITDPNAASISMEPATSTSNPQMVTSHRNTDSGGRSSSGSGRPSSGKRRDVSYLNSAHQDRSIPIWPVRLSSTSLRSHNHQQQLSQIEKSVTHLLIATKQLLETLTRWSRHSATEGEVSDVYVRLGYEFNIACRAFQSIGVDVSDLGPVPDLLRQILEETLSQEASQANLDRFLPRIRDIIINLLHGLKKKQQKLRAKQQNTTRQLSSASSSTTGTVDTSLTDMLEGVPSRYGSSISARSPEKRNGSGSGGNVIEDQSVPARTSSSQHARAMSRDDTAPRLGDDSPRGSLREKKAPPPSLSDSSLSSNTMQNIPVMTPEEYKLPIQRMSVLEEPPPPPPPPKQQDALLALQRGGELERRASRRYSAYQISKHLGAAPGGVPMLPTQNSPIPNRGRDVRDSLNAVRTRSSLVPSRSKSSRLRESPSRVAAASNRISEEPEPIEPPEPPKVDTKAPPVQQDDSPLVKTPEDKLGTVYVDAFGTERPALGATLRGPPLDNFAPPLGDPDSLKESAAAEIEPTKMSSIHVRGDSTEPDQFIPEQSPQPGKELTLFLQYKSKIKKIVLPDGSNELSIARLQLAFIEKFAWNTHNNGVDLPEIYIQDQVSGVRHELEDLNDIKDRSVLVLNVEALDEVKRHFDEGIGGLKKVVEGIRSVMDGQQMTIAHVSDRQDAATKEIARLATLPAPVANRLEPAQVNGVRPFTAPEDSQAEINSLRLDLAAVRQTLQNFSSDMTTSMTAVREKAEAVKAKAADVSIQLPEGDPAQYVSDREKVLIDDVGSNIKRVDDLSDIVEDLRKDVVNRGVRPLPRQLDQVNKDIRVVTKELKRVQTYVEREKPVWTKIWQKQLESVCQQRDELTSQENLIADLSEDMETITGTIHLIEQATKQQDAQANSGHGVTLRSTSRGLNVGNTDIDPIKAKDGVLGEVRALQPNHENRLAAIERAEKARKEEQENGREHGAFRHELAQFVEEGKLKASGGVGELEKSRQIIEETTARELWSEAQAKKAERIKKRAADRARQEKAQMMAANGELVEPGEGTEGIEDSVKENGIKHDPTDEDSEPPPPPPPKEDRDQIDKPPLPGLSKIDDGSGMGA